MSQYRLPDRDSVEGSSPKEKLSTKAQLDRAACICYCKRSPHLENQLREGVQLDLGGARMNEHHDNLLTVTVCPILDQLMQQDCIARPLVPLLRDLILLAFQ